MITLQFCVFILVSHALLVGLLFDKIKHNEATNKQIYLFYYALSMLITWIYITIYK